MLLYLSTKAQFIADVFSNEIENKILTEFRNKLHRSVGKPEVDSWRNSLGHMHRVMVSEEIPGDAGVAIEFNIPRTSKRIDFIVTGLDHLGDRSAVIIELKQWQHVDGTPMDGIVRTFLGRADREVNHPSYQAWSYAALLEDFNEAVRTTPINLKPCAYLHNCSSPSDVTNVFYAPHTDRAPVFLKSDAEKLRTFIRSHVKQGDSGQTMDFISKGRIAPSKSLVDSLCSMLKGNREFVMIDDQKLVYETAIYLAKHSTSAPKNVLIVDGGPGTGKSVVAINLLVEMTKAGQAVQYVTKNAAPRAVFESKLTGTFSKSRISNLFTSSGAFTSTSPNSFDTLIVDEAHRLNEKGGLFGNMGENQIKELINSAKHTIFFIDEDQRVTFRDIGEKAEIHKWANALGAKVHELTLQSQFRCNGSDGYLAWIDHLLQIRETANPTLEGIKYELIVCDTARQLRELIIEKDRSGQKARMVAGYCWDWISKSSPNLVDIKIPSHNFEARWNLASDGSLWIIKPESVNEVGCIHTCQGLELDYVGVIFGQDLLVRNGVVVTDASRRAKTDKSIRGYKGMLKSAPRKAKSKAADIIKNTYRTLMTRGMKGCFVTSIDPETNQYLKDRSVR